MKLKIEVSTYSIKKFLSIVQGLQDFNFQENRLHLGAYLQGVPKFIGRAEDLKIKPVGKTIFSFKYCTYSAVREIFVAKATHNYLSFLIGNLPEKLLSYRSGQNFYNQVKFTEIKPFFSQYLLGLFRLKHVGAPVNGQNVPHLAKLFQHFSFTRKTLKFA